MLIDFIDDGLFHQPLYLLDGGRLGMFFEAGIIWMLLMDWPTRLVVVCPFSSSSQSLFRGRNEV